MLNADMALIRNLSSKTDDGEVSCNYTTCPVANSETVTWVDAFADDNNLWIDEFSKAFEKMIESGWEGQLKEVDSDDEDCRAMPTLPTTTSTTAVAVVVRDPLALLIDFVVLMVKLVSFLVKF